MKALNILIESSHPAL